MPCGAGVTWQHHPLRTNIWGALAAVSLRGPWGRLGAEEKKETTTNVGNTRYGLYNRAAGPGRPYSFAIVAPCGKMHYYSWQGLWRGTQGLGGPSPWGLAAPRGHPPCTHTGRDGMPGAEQRVVAIAVTSRSLLVGTTHPHSCPWGQPGCPNSLDIPLGRCRDAGKLVGHRALLAHLGVSSGTRVARQRGAARWRGGECVCVCVSWFSPPGADPERRSELFVCLRACLSRLPAFPSHLAQRAATLAGAVLEF